MRIDTCSNDKLSLQRCLVTNSLIKCESGRQKVTDSRVLCFVHEPHVPASNQSVWSCSPLSQKDID